MELCLVGDIHGCYDELRKLLDEVEFDPGQDVLWLTGDLVARGPKSLEVLRYLFKIRPAVRMVLGNHDLHLLSVFVGASSERSQDQISTLLRAPDLDELMHWLRHQPLLQVDEERKLVMSHAGITPQWDLETAKMCARELEYCLAGDDYVSFLKGMYSNVPNYWTPSLSGIMRLRFIANVLTRMRYCFDDGKLELSAKMPPAQAPAYLKPWFRLKRLVPLDYTLVFGHWAALEGKGTPEGTIPLDTGCYKGGDLTLLRWRDKQFFVQSAPA